ncbi:hypothetical protein [Brevundimonas sp. M20]|uniref:DUF6881 domain-containing protein n=1 Tax=Brevundimonas sp. M20 TaxID=2591463 RepID=UPI00351A0099
MEIDADRWERRGVSIFADGTAAFADGHESHGREGLCPLPLPSIDVIASDPEFEPAEVTRVEFEQVWDQAKTRLR